MINFSKLLWKPRPLTDEPSLPSVGSSAESPETVFDLRQVPVEEVQIEAATRVVVYLDPQSPGADRFRFLRMRLRELRSLGKLRSIVITSPVPQDGKSTIALNLATVLAEKGRQTVLLIEADLYQPALSHRLGLQSREGFAECLEDGLDPLSALQRLEPLGWYFLPAGTPRGNPTELLQTDLALSVIQRLSPYFDWILIDTPPVIPLTDALLLSRHTDASLLVVRADRTPREVVEEAISLLGPKNVLGIVLNGAEELNRLYSEYAEYYGKK